jgi:hypothetical protein
MAALQMLANDDDGAASAWQAAQGLSARLLRLLKD